MAKILIRIPERAITKYNGLMRSRQGGIYLRPEVKCFEAACRYHAMREYKGPVLEGPLEVNIGFHFDNNKMPDLFNLPKAVCDALNKVIWKDDRQILKGNLSKLNSGYNEIVVEISY